jgi:hypothetical protein
MYFGFSDPDLGKTLSFNFKFVSKYAYFLPIMYDYSVNMLQAMKEKRNISRGTEGIKTERKRNEFLGYDTTPIYLGLAALTVVHSGYSLKKISVCDIF